MLSDQSRNNLELFPVGRRVGEYLFTRTGFWIKLTTWLYDVAKQFKLSDKVYANTLYLLADYYSDNDFVKEDFQMTGLACMSISDELCEIYPPELEDWIYIADNSFTKSKFLDKITDVSYTCRGKMRYITPVDIYLQLKYDQIEQGDINTAIKISLILQSCHVKYVSIETLKLVELCLSITKKLRTKDFTDDEKGIYEIMNRLGADNRWEGRFKKDFGPIFEMFPSKEIKGKKMSLQDSPSRTRLSPRKSYETVYELGSGAYGSVILGSRIGEVFAVKRQKTQQSSVKEITILSTYKHINILELISFSINQTEVELELESGYPLSNLVFGDKVEDERFKKWNEIYIERNYEMVFSNEYLENRQDYMADIINGVYYLHSVGVLHLDIKIDNVIIVNNVAKLADFGISELMVLTKNDVTPRSEAVTVNYRCPELLLLENNQPYDIKNKRKESWKYTFGPDIWSVGTVFLEMMTGVTAFPYIGPELDKYGLIDVASNVLLHITKILGAPKNIEDYPYNYPGTGLEVIKDIYLRKKILKMLEYHPDKRSL